MLDLVRTKIVCFLMHRLNLNKFNIGISREATEALSDASRLSGIESHKEVLARWSDDGWYYHGHVIKEGKHKCIVQDATGYHEGITKEDIIVEADHNFDIIQVNMIWS